MAPRCDAPNSLTCLSTLLAHPITRQPLRLQQGGLIEPGSQARFPILDGIPSVLPGRLPRRHRFWAWVYDRLSFAYDLGASLAWRWSLGGAPLDRQSYLPRIEVERNARVLEAGCGTGTNLLQLPAWGRYVGLDISRNMLLRCRRKLRQGGRAAQLVHADAQHLPFADNCFDVVIQVGSLQFLQDPRSAVAEMLRTARPGAAIWIIDETASIPGLLRRSRVRLGSGRDAAALHHLVPAGSRAAALEAISSGELFCLRFQKK